MDDISAAISHRMNACTVPIRDIVDLYVAIKIYRIGIPVNGMAIPGNIFLHSLKNSFIGISNSLIGLGPCGVDPIQSIYILLGIGGLPARAGPFLLLGATFLLRL